MRDEERPFREAEGRLAEHTEGRTAWRLRHVPDYATVYRGLRRREGAALERPLRAVVQRLAPPSAPQATAAVDSTGLAPGAIRPCFVKRAQDRGDGVPGRHWLKWTMAVDADRQLILAQAARRAPTNDGATLRPLVAAAHQRAPIALVRADAECARERTHPHVRQTLQAQSIMPATRGGAAWQIHGVRAHMRQEFPADLYRRRALIASLTSAVNRKLSARAPGRSLPTQCLQALLLGMAYNSYRLWCFRLLARPRMSTAPSYVKIRFTHHKTWIASPRHSYPGCSKP